MTVALACLLWSAMLVTVTETEVVDVTPGAVNRPVAEMVPELAVQVTAELLVLLTVAVNCLAPLEVTVAAVGEIETLIALVPLIVTTALACWLVSATLVAVTETWVVVVTAGAVNRPVAEMVPALAVQVTAELLVLLTVAVNCLATPEATVAVVGETETLIGGVPVPLIVTVALAILLGSATLAAFTETVVVVATLGAVNMPVGEMVPALAVQVTPKLLVLLTVAVNCFELLEATVAAVGKIVILAGGLVGALLLAAEENPPHEAAKPVIRHNIPPRQRFCTRDTGGVFWDTVLTVVPAKSSVMQSLESNF